MLYFRAVALVGVAIFFFSNNGGPLGVALTVVAVGMLGFAIANSLGVVEVQRDGRWSAGSSDSGGGYDGGGGGCGGGGCGGGGGD
ncbi:hypothetical protein [Nocardia jiangsuensis]|uniref:Uncharacterized protein n=1 Tax=Nocardia jiangsuensis TaxID=1691563 RepID=A0ABV8DXC2_9NOCA